MEFYAESKVLTVGINEKAKVLKRLPIQVLSLHYGSDAKRSFKMNRYDSVVSRWNLDDLPNGRLLKGIRMIRPDLPTIAIVEAGNPEQEIAARRLGVSAVLTEDTSEEVFIETVCQVLGIESMEQVGAVYAENEMSS